MTNEEMLRVARQCEAVYRRLADRQDIDIVVGTPRSALRRWVARNLQRAFGVFRAPVITPEETQDIVDACVSASNCLKSIVDGQIVPGLGFVGDQEKPKEGV